MHRLKAKGNLRLRLKAKGNLRLHRVAHTDPLEQYPRPISNYHRRHSPVAQGRLVQQVCSLQMLTASLWRSSKWALVWRCYQD